MMMTPEPACTPVFLFAVQVHLLVVIKRDQILPLGFAVCGF